MEYQLSGTRETEQLESLNPPTLMIVLFTAQCLKAGLRGTMTVQIAPVQEQGREVGARQLQRYHVKAFDSVPREAPPKPCGLYSRSSGCPRRWQGSFATCTQTSTWSSEW